MPELNDPQLVSFCNEVVRPFADSITHIDQHLATILTVYNDRNLGTIISDGGPSNLIADGSAEDGRTRRVGGDVFNIVTLITDLKAFFDTTGRRDVIVGWQVNGIV